MRESPSDFDPRATQEMPTPELSDYDDPNSSRFDSVELRVIHRDERAAENRRGTRFLKIGAIAFIPLVVLAIILGNIVGGQRMATLAARATSPTTQLVYVSPTVTIWVQRINLAHPEVDFSILVASTNSHHVTSIYTFVMSDDPPKDGRTYVLHCTYNHKFYTVAADLFLYHPMTGAQFNGGGILYLALGRQGKYLLRTP